MSEADYTNSGTVEEVARNSTLQMSQVESALVEVVNSIDLGEYLQSSFSESEDPELVYRNPPTEFVFCVPKEEWLEIAKKAGLGEIESRVAREYHMRRGELITRSDTSHTVPDGWMYFVIPISDIWSWYDAQVDLEYQFKEFAEKGLTPAEMVDYWMVEFQDNTPKEWAESRGVHPESVRKNARQARRK